MEKINKWMTKKNMTIVGFIGFLSMCLLLQRAVGDFLYKTCQNYSLGEVCMNTINYFSLLLLFCATMFVPVLVTLSLRTQVFEAWKKTLFIYLFIYLFVVFITPEYFGDEFFHIEKDIIALIASAIYVIFSVLYIANKNQQLKSE